MTPTAIPAKGHKRKHPPTFQHLPDERAKKLKREWVQKEKIKSKWRSEKRKEGLSGATVRVQASGEQADAGTVPETQDNEIEADTDTSHKNSILRAKPAIDDELRRPEKGGSSHLSLRRSDKGLSRRRGGGSSSSGRGRGSAIGRGKGKQPDMRAKMSTLLEKITKDHAQ